MGKDNNVIVAQAFIKVNRLEDHDKIKIDEVNRQYQKHYDLIIKYNDNTTKGKEILQEKRSRLYR